MFLAVRDLYKKEGGALPEQVINVAGSTPTPPIQTWPRC